MTVCAHRINRGNCVRFLMLVKSTENDSLMIDMRQSCPPTELPPQLLPLPLLPSVVTIERTEPGTKRSPEPESRVASGQCVG